VSGSIVRKKVVFYVMNEWQHLAYCEAEDNIWN